MHVPCMQYCDGRQLFVCEIEIRFGSKQTYCWIFRSFESLNAENDLNGSR